MLSTTAFNATAIAQQSGTAEPETTAAETDTDRAARNRKMFQDAQTLLRNQQFEEAAEKYKTLIAFDPDNALAWFNYGLSLHSAGRYREALPAHIMAAEFVNPQSNIRSAAPYNAACVYAIEGKSDDAFRWLDKAIRRGFRLQQLLRNDPDLDAIRDDPRFDAIMKQMQTPRKTSAAQIDETVPGVEFKPVMEDPAGLPAKRQFDFWVGRWDVFNTEKEKVGENVVQKMVGGNLIMENWTAANGTTGKSMNFYNPVEKSWTQQWVGEQGRIITMTGGFEDGAMRLVGSSTNGNGDLTDVRCSFTPQPDGKVRQLIEVRNAAGSSWSTSFEGIYRRQSQRPETNGSN